MVTANTSTPEGRAAARLSHGAPGIVASARRHRGAYRRARPALAAPGEVLVSQTVRDLVAGSGLTFEERGLHTLKACRKRGCCSGRFPNERAGPLTPSAA
jgi:hypothetical protein